MFEGYDLLIPTLIVPFEVNPPVKLGKLTLNRNFNNFFAEPESISFAPSNVVDGVSWVPDPLLQWRLMVGQTTKPSLINLLTYASQSYDDTSTHRHGSPNGATLPINRPIAPVNNNYRDGYMQPYIYEVRYSWVYYPDRQHGAICPFSDSLPLHCTLAQEIGAAAPY
jgi:catalase